MQSETHADIKRLRLKIKHNRMRAVAGDYSLEQTGTTGIF